jgi:surface antigen
MVKNIKTINKTLLILLILSSIVSFRSSNPKIGDVIDSYNGVNVFYNGKNYSHVNGRNTTVDGYNLGLKYQCVEFVKRYYYDYYGHKMPSSYGHARDYFDTSLPDVAYNSKRDLMQYRNVRAVPPMSGDILVYGPCESNKYGHVAIVTNVSSEHIELIQQNYGTQSRLKIPIVRYESYYTVADFCILGWLRMKED